MYFHDDITLFWELKDFIIFFTTRKTPISTSLLTCCINIFVIKNTGVVNSPINIDVSHNVNDGTLNARTKKETTLLHGVLQVSKYGRSEMGLYEESTTEHFGFGLMNRCSHRYRDWYSLIFNGHAGTYRVNYLVRKQIKAKLNGRWYRQMGDNE